MPSKTISEVSGQKIRRLPLGQIIMILIGVVLVVSLFATTPFYVVFTSTLELPAYTEVTNANVRKVIDWWPPDGAITKLEDPTFVRVTTVTIPRDTVVTNNMLVTLPQTVSTWEKLIIPGSPVARPVVGEPVKIQALDKMGKLLLPFSV